MTHETVSLESIQPKPQELVLAQYVEREQRNLQGDNPYWYSPNNWNRWLVRLDCDCVTEVLTHFKYDAPSTEHDYKHHLGPDDGPVFKRTSVGHPLSMRGHCMLGDTMDLKESRKINPFPSGCCRPTNTVWCSDHHDKSPWRKVAKYIARKSYYDHKSGELKHYWNVALSCGHCYGPHSADEDWSPGMPPYIDDTYIDGMKKKIQRWESEGKHLDFAQDFREQIDHNGFLACRPAMEEECRKCSYLRRITEYKLIGKLSDEPWQPPVKPKPEPKTAEEVRAEKLAELQKVEASIKRMEAKAERLRRETQ